MFAYTGLRNENKMDDIIFCTKTHFGTIVYPPNSSSSSKWKIKSQNNGFKVGGHFFGTSRTLGMFPEVEHGFHQKSY
jgi:hypothetical protein